MATHEIKIDSEILIDHTTTLTNTLESMEKKLSGCVTDGGSKFTKRMVSGREDTGDFLNRRVIEEGLYLANLIEATRAVLVDTDQKMCEEMEG